MLATSATPCAKVARGQTGLQKAEEQLTYPHVGAKPLIKPLQIRAEFLIPPRKNPPLSIQQRGSSDREPRICPVVRTLEKASNVFEPCPFEVNLLSGFDGRKLFKLMHHPPQVDFQAL